MRQQNRRKRPRQHDELRCSDSSLFPTMGACAEKCNESGKSEHGCYWEQMEQLALHVVHRQQKDQFTWMLRKSWRKLNSTIKRSATINAPVTIKDRLPGTPFLWPEKDSVDNRRSGWPLDFVRFGEPFVTLGLFVASHIMSIVFFARVCLFKWALANKVVIPR